MFLTSKLGEALNVSLRFEGFVWVGGFMKAYFGDGNIKAIPVSIFLQTGVPTTVGFSAFLDYDYFSTSTVSNKHTSIVMTVEWDLTKTADGIEVDNMRLGAGQYESHYLNLEFIASGSNSSPTKRARIMIQGKLSPTQNTSGSGNLSIPVIGGVGYSQAAEVTSAYAVTRQWILEFVDMPRPAKRVDPPPPLPPDLRVYFDEGSANIDKIPKRVDAQNKTPREQVDTWINALPSQYSGLWKVMTAGEHNVISIAGFASNTATSAINDRISNERAANVKNLVVAHGVADKAIIKQAWGIDRPTPVPHQARPGPHADERYVLITVLKDDATKAILQLRQ